MLVLIMRTPFHWVYFVYTFSVTYIDFCLYKRHKLTILFNYLVTFCFCLYQSLLFLFIKC